MKKIIATVVASAVVTLATALSVNWGAPQGGSDSVNWGRPPVHDSVNWGQHSDPDSVNWGRVNWNGNAASAPDRGTDSVNWG